MTQGGSGESAICQRSVGILVADGWIEKVLDVKHAREKLLVVRVIVGRSYTQLDICLCSLHRREGQWWKKWSFWSC